MQTFVSSLKVYVTTAKFDSLAALSVKIVACGTLSHMSIQFGISLPEGGSTNLRRNVSKKLMRIGPCNILIFE